MKKLLIITLLSALVAQPAVALSVNDPFTNEQWWLDSLNMGQVWEGSQGDDVVIAVIDSGVYRGHPDLEGQIWVNQGEIAGDGVDNDGNGYIDDVYGWDYVDDDATTGPEGTPQCFASGGCTTEAYNHGTVIAGIIAAKANNSVGVAGLAHNAKIMSLRALDSTGVGSSERVRQAIAYAVNNGADVINMSFVGPSQDTQMAAIIELAYENDVAVVVAAGNAEDMDEEGVNLTISPRYPVCDEGSDGIDISMGTASHDTAFRLSDFSNFGNCVDIMSSGEQIFSTTVRDQSINELDTWYEGGFQGTSMAAPMVSGALALLRSAYPDAPVGDLFRALREGAQDVSNENQDNLGEYGAGALDIQGAFGIMVALADPGPEEPQEPETPAESPGRLLTTSETDSVYYIASDNKRYAFPDQRTYFSWFEDFSSVEEVAPTELSQYTLGGNVTYRPGVGLIKIQSIPKVYATGPDNQLHWITSEEVARAIYGDNWAFMVSDISDAFFVNYQISSDITASNQYSPSRQQQLHPTIDHALGLVD